MKIYYLILKFIKKNIKQYNYIFFGVLVLTTCVYLYVRDQNIYTKERLLELGVARERIFWDCLKKDVDEQEKADLKVFLDKVESGEIEIERVKRESFIFRDDASYFQRDWAKYSEISSKKCSQIADESIDGKLLKEFRNKISQKVITDNELYYKIREQYIKEKYR